LRKITKHGAMFLQFCLILSNYISAELIFMTFKL